MFISGTAVAAWPVYAALEAARATCLTAPDGLAGWFARAVDADARMPDMAARAGSFVAEGDAAAAAAMDRIVELLAP